MIEELWQVVERRLDPDDWKARDSWLREML